MKTQRMTPTQKKALSAYNFALAQEDRYLGSVFVNAHGQRKVEERTKIAYEEFKRLGMDHTSAFKIRPCAPPRLRTSSEGNVRSLRRRP